MGMRTLLATINLDSIAKMSCNPAIGGLAKGQLVREVDALGGEMGKVIDQTGIQFRMLNMGKGPAVRGPRAQADKKLYQTVMKHALEQQPGLSLRQDLVDGLIVRDGRVQGVRTASGGECSARAVILTTGTFLKGLIHIGQRRFAGGRAAEPSAERLSDRLRELGFEVGRLKTGTPPRVNGRTIDYSSLASQYSDSPRQPFSFSTDEIRRPDFPCYITYTQPRTNQIIQENIHRAPLYTGQIQSTGPRYCPSIEVKVVRFPEKQSHQVFLEPEGEQTLEVYCNGLATSIPMDVQEEMVRSIPGLETAEITRYGYAIEYDFVPSTQIYPSLETKLVENLFHAGQINGTSGYEEAAGQGIMAGINAVRKLRGESPLVLDRSEAYIGVLIDDLVTLGTEEPYRMFTSRAEYRLLLRQDNADRRLMRYGHECGLISAAAWEKLQTKERLIEETKAYIAHKKHGPHNLAKLLRRTENHFLDIEAVDEELADKNLPSAVKEQVEIEAKYEGYLARQLGEIAKFRKMENRKLSPHVDYSAVKELSREAREKLSQIRPLSVGQASRISGVSPADISVLIVLLTRGALPARDTRQS